MHEFENIKVNHSPSIELLVDNPTGLELIGKGAHGAVFKLPGNRCVKMYADSDIALMEAQAYKRAQDSEIIPKVYESGDKYLIMEYIDGTSLLELLSQRKELTPGISMKLIKLFWEMLRIGFTRIDTSLRHVIIDECGVFKLVDLACSCHVLQEYPQRAFNDLKELSLLHPFLKHLEEFDPVLYGTWIAKAPAALLEKEVDHE